MARAIRQSGRSGPSLGIGGGLRATGLRGARPASWDLQSCPAHHQPALQGKDPACGGAGTPDRASGPGPGQTSREQGWSLGGRPSRHWGRSQPAGNRGVCPVHGSPSAFACLLFVCFVVKHRKRADLITGKRPAQGHEAHSPVVWPLPPAPSPLGSFIFPNRSPSPVGRPFPLPSPAPDGLLFTFCL